ncbi:2-dehydropantoate 2-reductase [Roseomonas sp. NAR14]|uniref:2-dehydropantoate 2-reductase n=1 Tax=Roseomonas acroporae TaxID=2937791 RepID=A0A9X2BWA2_9PROT|nr:2-dehydropantoate 2-reductase [Roseomonas acroporae]MCK8785816.1 2-dehydropantoate 2-reductase [Roseomonas acroporae]
MRICVFGAGAIGGHVATRLARGGADVSIVARGAQLEAIRERGLTVHAPGGVLHARPRAAADPAELGPQDAVLVTTKQPALPSVAAAIGPLLGPDTTVAFVMNGIPWWYFDHDGGPLDGTRLPTLDPGEAVRRAVGIGRTLGGVVYSACTVVEPGVIHTEHDRNRLLLGEPDGSASPRAEAIAAAIAADGGFQSPVVSDIRTEVWAKLVGNIANGPLCVLGRQGIRDAYREPAVMRAAERMTHEALAIARALGREVAISVEKRMQHSAGIAHKPSILQDLELGRPMEIEAQWAVPLRLARKLGVATPTLDLVIGLAKQAAMAAGLYREPEAA